MDHFTSLTAAVPSTQERCAAFAALHEAGMFVVPNAWDAASAVVMAQAGAPAIATTSSGVSWSLGVADGEHVGRAQALSVLGRIVGSVTVPVSADLEAGYGATPAEVAVTVEQAVALGAVGANLEDSPGVEGSPLRSVDAQSERLAAARAAADRALAGFTLNARTDVFLAGVGAPDERLRLVLEREKHYRDAGADCLFVPALADPSTISELVERSGLPINLMLPLGSELSLARLRELGVRRVSLGSALARAAYGAAASTTRQLLAGDVPAADGVPPHPEVQALFHGLVATAAPDSR